MRSSSFDSDRGASVLSGGGAFSDGGGASPRSREAAAADAAAERAMRAARAASEAAAREDAAPVPPRTTGVAGHQSTTTPRYAASRRVAPRPPPSFSRRFLFLLTQMAQLPVHHVEQQRPCLSGTICPIRLQNAAIDGKVLPAWPDHLQRHVNTCLASQRTDAFDFGTAKSTLKRTHARRA